VKAAATKPILVGIQVVSDAAAVQAVVGFGQETPDTKELYQALINDLNARGGIGGRKVVPVWVERSATAPDQSVEQQAACATFTQDNKVMAALIYYQHDILVPCLEKAGVPAIGYPGHSYMDAVEESRYHLYAKAGLDITRLARSLVEGLFAQGYFTKGAKIGLVTYDSPGYVRATASALKPALARHGLRVADEVRVKQIDNLQALGDAGPPIQNAILRFKTSGVTHVMFFGSTGLAFVFMTSADSQKYQPRYGISSNDGPGSLEELAPASQLKGTMGVGWSISDLTNPSANAQAKLCESRLHQPRSVHNYTWPICDQVWLFEAAAKAAGANLNAQTLMAGLRQTGTTDVAVVGPVWFGPGHWHGVTAARHLAFLDKCSCFQYTSGRYSVR
jgi:ABC-type branched-subunit amino acid transport system substrate-binding protein